METITIKIKKSYAKEVIADLEKMDAIAIEKLPIINPADLIGSWAPKSLDTIDVNIEKLRVEWR